MRKGTVLYFDDDVIVIGDDNGQVSAYKLETPMPIPATKTYRVTRVNPEDVSVSVLTTDWSPYAIPKHEDEYVQILDFGYLDGDKPIKISAGYSKIFKKWLLVR